MYIQSFYFKTKNHSNINNRKSIWKYSQSGHREMRKLPHSVTANPLLILSLQKQRGGSSHLVNEAPFHISSVSFFSIGCDQG